MQPLVIQQNDGFTLEVILNSNLKNCLLLENTLKGDFIWNNFVNNSIYLKLDTFSIYHCSNNYYELTLTKYQLDNPDKKLSYSSNSIYLDTNRGNPLRIRILEDSQHLLRN